MIRSMRRSVGERIDHAYYALLRTTVTRFAPAMVRFDEGDPLLSAGFERPDQPAQVIDAWKMLSIEASRAASNSAGLCCAVSPSVRAREKLATTPWLRASSALASSRV